MLDGNRDAYLQQYPQPTQRHTPGQSPAVGLHKLAAATKATIALASGPPLPLEGVSFGLTLENATTLHVLMTVLAITPMHATVGHTMKNARTLGLFSSSEIDLAFDFASAFAFGGNFGAGTPGVSAFGGAGGAARPLGSAEEGFVGGFGGGGIASAFAAAPFGFFAEGAR